MKLRSLYLVVGFLFTFGLPASAAADATLLPEYNPCDSDRDGVVDGRDLAAFAAAFGSASGDRNYNPSLDFDVDGDIDQVDLDGFSVYYTCDSSLSYVWPATGPSLRIMTYNTALIFSHDSGMTIEQRAGLIADAVRADAPDVVVLNEVFDNNDGKKKIGNRLSYMDGMYPYYIRMLDYQDPNSPGVLPEMEDSGLMLFSRYKFADVDGGIQELGGIVKQWNYGPPAAVSWVHFIGANKNGWDWWAYKGVGMVRILNQSYGDEPFNVAFTHLQSTESTDSVIDVGEDIDDRQEELVTIREVVEASVDGNKLLSEPVFLAGDLNINGNLLGDQGSYYSCNEDGVCVTEPYNEWQYAFDSTNPSNPINDRHNGFYACRGETCTYDPNASPVTGSLFTDPWGFETSPLDPGQTQSGSDLTFPVPEDGERLDYILHNDPVSFASGAPKLCLQHITRGFTETVKYGVDVGHSDHLPVTADFNLTAPRCSPHPEQNDPNNPNLWGPEEVIFDPLNPSAPNHDDVTFTDGTITHPGSMQWYLIKQAYPCEIRLFGTHVAFDVYQGSDLSAPIAPWDGDCEELIGAPGYECTYTLYDPPYYVRVYAVGTADGSDPSAKPDRTLADLNYSIWFHRFTCSSVDDACPIKPAVDSPAWIWPIGLLNPYAQPPDDDTMFFVFTTEYARDGSSPLITFLLNSEFPTDPNPFTMSLTDANGTPVCTSPDCPNNDGLASHNPSPTEWLDHNGNGIPDRLATAQYNTMPGANGWPERYYLKVRRDPYYLGAQKSVFVRYETSLNYFRPINLDCGEERTDLGDDDLTAGFIYDSLTVTIGLPGLFDDGDQLHEAGTQNWWFTWPFELDGAFVDALQPWMREDSNSYTFVSPLYGFWIHAIDKSERIGDPVYKGKYTWSDETDPDNAEYWYDMTYELSHQRPPCRIYQTGGPNNSPDCLPTATCEFGACR